jgi:hypothetical protein
MQITVPIHFFFFFKIVFKIASLSTLFWVGVSNQNFTYSFFPEFDFLGGHFWTPTTVCLIHTPLYVWMATLINWMPVRYQLLLWWQQNRSKATMYLLYKIPAIWGCPRYFFRLMSVCCMLLPHNHYRVHQHFMRHVCELSCSSKHRLLRIFPIFEH